jgi:hypothetical protein
VFGTNLQEIRQGLIVQGLLTESGVFANGIRQPMSPLPWRCCSVFGGQLPFDSYSGRHTWTRGETYYFIERLRRMTACTHGCDLIDCAGTGIRDNLQQAIYEHYRRFVGLVSKARLETSDGRLTRVGAFREHLSCASSVSCGEAEDDQVATHRAGTRSGCAASGVAATANASQAIFRRKFDP